MRTALPCLAATVLLLGLMASQAVATGANVTPSAVEPRAGSWRTWVLSSGGELRPPAPPDRDATNAELQELQRLASQRDAAVREQIAFWDAGAPGYRWDGIGGRQLQPARRASGAVTSAGGGA